MIFVKKEVMVGILFVVIVLIGFGFVIAATDNGDDPAFSGGDEQVFGGESGLVSADVGSNSGSGSDINLFGSSSNPQFYPPGYSGYNSDSLGSSWNGYNSGMCIPGQDLILMIPPGGCSPAVVRSDLLEEQNVPVFCKVSALQVNPLIDITRIRSLRFSGEYPKGVSGVSYFPARSAVGGQRYTGDDLYKDNLGYLVVVLSRISNEDDMPDFVAGNISAMVSYDSEAGFGLGDTNIYLSEMTDREWDRDYKEYSFWNGKGYVRVDSIEDDKATISIYRDFNTRQETVTLSSGESSGDLYLSGFYCGAGLRIKIDKIGYPVDSALLQVNDEQIWVSKGDKILNNQCTITNLKIEEGRGDIKIKCPGNDLVELSLGGGSASFSSGDVNLGGRLGDKVYLGYMGQDLENNRYVVLVKDEFSNTEIEFTNKNVLQVIEKSIKGDDLYADLKDKVQKEVRDYYVNKLSHKRDEVDAKVSVEVVREGNSGYGVDLSRVNIARDRNWDDNKLTPQQILSKNYYDEAISEYENLIELYPNEKMEFVEEDTSAAKALLDAARLSRKLGMDAKAQEYYSRLIRDYPNSDSVVAARMEASFLLRYDTKDSKASVRVSNQHYFIDLLNLKKPTQGEASAILLIDGRQETLGVGETKTISKDNFFHSFKLINIRDDYVDITYEKTGGTLKTPITRNKRLKTDESQLFEGINAKLVRVNLKKQVKLNLFAKSYGPGTESSFNFKVGIEKRAIKISPEKAKEMMENLQETIVKWQDINDNLGNVIKGLKGACFATSSLLTVKNLVEGATGKSLARGTLMQNSKGWNEECERLINENSGRYTSLHQCLLDKSGEVEGDINAYSQEIQNTNEIMKGIQDKVGRERSDVLDFQGQVDSQKVNEEFKLVFDDWCQQQSGSVKLPGTGTSSLSFGNSKDSICNLDTMTHEQRRDIMTWNNAKTGGSSVLRNVAEEELGKTLLEAKNYNEGEGLRNKAEDEANNRNLGIRTTNPEGDSVTYGYIKNVGIADGNHQVYRNFAKDDSVVRVYIPPKESLGNGKPFVAHADVAGKQVLVPVKYSPEDSYFIPDETGKIYGVDGNALGVNATNSVRDYMSLSGMNRIKQSDKKAYQNRMRDSKDIMVKYFERAPYKGLPAEIPFDVENGWYVEMNYVLSGFGQPYEESGRVINFYICNVGGNGLIEYKKSGDDICRYYNAQSGAEINFPGLSLSESRTLISKAQRAIQEASRQYGKERVTINGQSFKTGTSFGGEEGRCTDFMSVQDCTLLFNVCDPVICPASRCDFGGKYQVDNVIQSGIIGSLLLCMPNFKEGVMVPICLTGVHAGIDGYLSILNSTAECLNESIETGRNIGICDEIKSIYLCDFFWKQAIPLMDVVVPRMFEGIYGQGARGGGEYLTVQGAWDNMKNAASYFTQNYAVNSVRAFNSRSAEYALESIGEEVGTEFCKGFISANFGSAKNFFNALIDPDSPEQYNAWFSEFQMTTATTPATSHYKVYYHIYAGKDIGAQYVIYLKDLPQLGGVRSIGYYTVDRGYVKRGDQVDQARDFVAASGFRQLCVSVNGREECGFGKVSTSYALNALSETFVADQITTDIKSEKECVAGTPSIGSLLQPNLQAGVEEVINPALYNKGIIRVCATDNPGKQVLATGEFDNTRSTYDRWKEVGYCDDPSLKCWLDTETVKDVITNKDLEDQVLGNVERNVFDDSGYFTSERSKIIGDSAQDFINRIGSIISEDDTEESIDGKISPVVISLMDLTRKGTTNVHKARAHYLLGLLYNKVAEELWKGPEGSVVIYGDLDEEDDIVYENDPDIDFEDSSGDGSGDSSGADDSGGDDDGLDEAPPVDEGIVEGGFDTGDSGDEVDPFVDGETPWTDDRLRNNVLIEVRDNPLSSYEVEYSYNGNAWDTDDRDFNKNQGYLNGLGAIYDSLEEEGEGWVFYIYNDGGSYSQIGRSSNRDAFLELVFRRLER